MQRTIKDIPSSAQQTRLAALEAQNRELQARLQELTEQASRNAALFRKNQERELELLRTTSLIQLLERLVHGLKASYQLDALSLLLRDRQHEIRHLLVVDGHDPDEMRQIQFLDSLESVLPRRIADLDRPWLGAYSAGEHATFFPRGLTLGSVALIPLRRHNQSTGLLVFGSADPQRFTPELASDFLAHLGVVAAICIENSVNRARLLRSGYTDFLTGFHNRRYLQARLREELARAQRLRQPVACLLIDVDRFKTINDTHGHLAGDVVLREVARRIEGQMRLSDTSARFGGDEFAVVLPQAGLKDGERVADRTLQAVRAEPVIISESVTSTITLSIGVAAALPSAEVRDYSQLADELIAAADAALYRAKTAGRNQVAVIERAPEET